jgi:hypothetical protein
VFDVVIGIAIYFWAFKNTMTQSNQEFLNCPLNFWRRYSAEHAILDETNWRIFSKKYSKTLLQETLLYPYA